MSQKPIANGTIDRESTTLKTMFNMAIRDLKADINPFYVERKVNFFKEDNETERILNPEEIQRLLVECNGHLNQIVQFALNTAIRLREILYLKWSYVDFNRDIIIAPKTNTKNKKTKKVPMNGLMVKILQEIKRKSEYVFCDQKTGEPYHSIQTTFGKALKRAGLTGVRFHDLRHTASSNNDGDKWR
ncbi:MAG: site-specific integrase [Candidatus Scalinduaceae bacterium]